MADSQLTHWIYVLGGAEFRRQAHAWAQRKTSQGKDYRVIEAAPDEKPAGLLAAVQDDDVLYVFAPSGPGAIASSEFTPAQFAAQLEAEALPRTHRALKIFASSSGDPFPDGSGEVASFAERLYRTLSPAFPQICVYGYRGDVTPEGFDSHKTAALAAGETLDTISEHEWRNRSMRAQQNRVRFPAE
jgi:hypothetical protein